MYIYCIVNKVNGKMYVGKMSKVVKYSKSYMGSGKLIKKAIEKYGKDSFIKEILEENVAKEDLSFREMFWIKNLNTKLPNGYNLTDGGEGFIGLKRSQSQIEKHRKAITGKKASFETRNKMSQAHKGKKKSAEHVLHVSKALTGRKLSPEHVEKLAAAHRGKKISEEQKKMISDFHKGRSTSDETKVKMSLANKAKVNIQLLSLDGQVIATYESIKDAIRQTGATASGVFRCLSGERKTHKGYIWKRLNEDK
jgi:group I intron endonuclease